MNKTFKKLSVFLLMFAMVFALFGCKKNPDPVDPVDKQYLLTLEDYKAYVKNDLKAVVNSVGDVATSIKAAINDEYNKGVNAINAAATNKEAKEEFDKAKLAIANEIPLADGIFSYNSLSKAEKTDILGRLEAYAVRNGITGISLFENGGYVMYSPDVTLGTENYIVGYGFGNLAEGSINADLATEQNNEWKRYWHGLNPKDPGTANYWNDQGSEVGDFYGYFGAGYYTTFMNANKDGYDWVPELAKEKPIAVNPENPDAAPEDQVATTWKFRVKTGKDGLKYNTNSTVRAEYNNREVALEDYLTPYKYLLDANNNLYRGQEMTSKVENSSIKGAKTYYDKTKTGTPDFNEVGLKVYEDENGDEWFEITFVGALDQFYAMYYSTSTLYMPVPAEFIEEVGLDSYLGFNNDKTTTPVDNSLSLGAYTLETWNTESEVVYKKNPNYVFADTKFQIAGVHIKIFPAMENDQEASFNQFIGGYTHSCGIPETKLEEYKNDPRTKTSKGDSVFKLNVNATDAATWEKLFGENGTVCQTPKNEYWQVEPALSNEHFVKALSLSINRFEFASARGSVGTVDYLSSNYMSDPVNGISYSATEAHQAAIAGLLEGADKYGYSLELAREYFKMALMELEAEGAYTPNEDGTPVVIELEIAWMYPQHENAYHNEIAKYLKDAFNDESVSNGKYQLDVKFWVGNAWSDVYYNKMMKGQFDIGFGSISGNPLNPLSFVSVLSSDQEISGNFTLNWGTDTNDPLADILVYDGKRWSFDALWTAANGVAAVKGGANVAALSGELVSNEANDDGSYTAVYEFTMNLPEVTEVTAINAVLCWYEGDYKEDDIPSEFTVDAANNKIVVTMQVSKELVDAYLGAIGFDLFVDMKLGDYTSTDNYYGCESEFPKAENPSA